IAEGIDLRPRCRYKTLIRQRRDMLAKALKDHGAAKLGLIPSLHPPRVRGMSAPVVLISCVKSKRGQRCRAGDMYTSALFQKMMAYAQRLKPKRIFILSAKYGLLSPDEIEPYVRTAIFMPMGARRTIGLALAARQSSSSLAFARSQLSSR